MPDELQDTKSDQNDNRISEPGTSGPFKWFVLITYIIFSSSVAMSEIIFAPIPKQTAAYYGIKGKYSEIHCTEDLGPRSKYHEKISVILFIEKLYKYCIFINRYCNIQEIL